MHRLIQTVGRQVRIVATGLALLLAVVFWPATGQTSLASGAPGAQEALTPGHPRPYLEPDDSSREEDPYLRWRWFYAQRAYPNGEIPPGAMHRARMYLEKALFTRMLQSAPPVAGERWEQIGPAPAVRSPYPPTSGRVRSIAIQSSSVIYIGAASGGVWKTANGGVSWTPLTDDQPSLAMGSVALDPSNAAVVYAGTGEYGTLGGGQGLYGAGLLRSTDGGNTWTHLPGPWDTLQGGAAIQKIVVIPGPSPSNPNDDTVLVASSFGLFRSTQGGWDWRSGSNTNLTPVLGGDFSDVVIDPTNTNFLYAARNGVGIYRSSDGGQTWDADPSDPDVDPIWVPTGGCSIRRGALALAPTHTDVLYAVFHTPKDACGAGTGSGAIFRTPNARAATPMFYLRASPTSNWCGQCEYDLALIVQPIDPDGAGPLNPEDIVYVGALNFHRSTDGGSTWTNLQGVMHADVHTFAFDAGGTLYVGNDGGIDKLPNPATAPASNPGWLSLNTNLAITQFYPGVSLHPNSVEAGKPLALGGAQDNATGMYTGSLQWNRIGGGDGGYTAFDSNKPDKIFYISITGSGLDLQKTSNGGSNFTSVGPPSVNTLTIAAPVVMCPDNAQVLIVTDDLGVWRTDDGAGSWSDNSPAFGTVWHHSPRALAFAPGSSCSTYFAAGFRTGNPSTNYIFRTTTGGGTSWANWDDITSNLPNRAPTDIAVHPTNANVVYITFSGFCGSNASCPTGQGHVWVTTNALSPAVTWTDLTGGKGLPNVPVNAIALDPADPQRLYIGTDLGVYRSLDGGTSWELFNNGLPNVIVTDLVFNNNTRLLVAASYGRSMYRLRPAPALGAVFRVNAYGDVYADQGYKCGLSSGCLNINQQADVAEYVKVNEPVEPGDVLEIDPGNPGEYRRTRRAYSPFVVGVVSTAPAIALANHEHPGQGQRALVALMGIVPVKATAENGPIRPGDLLVAAKRPGHTMRCPKPSACIGLTVGKALEPLEKGMGIISMLVLPR